MPTIILHGCSLSDSVFTTDKAIFGVEICWNITRIQRDADSGMFGPPVSVPMSALPPMSSLHDANVDMDKVAGMLSTKPDVLQNPVLQVLVDVNGTTYRIPVDGNHRILARRMAGYSFFESYVVPIELEGRYRVTETVLP